ncbi:MAG: tyrosine-type recombinase/integrase, partial [Planctomycetaceae bacterium]|nr:tyrosine-type recombinase/integrase [Planctomycetaceae bacterium]
MARRPEIGNIQLYPDRPLRKSDRNGYVLKFYCPIQGKRIRRNCGTRDRREARRILRECQERLHNGEYVESDGAITSASASLPPRRTSSSIVEIETGPTWQECYDRYIAHQKSRRRSRTVEDTSSRLGIAEAILEAYVSEQNLSGGLLMRNVATLDAMEFLQNRLFDSEGERVSKRSPSTVNSVVRVVMAFLRYCCARRWVDYVPRVDKLDADEVMKGRPITEEEFQTMLQVTKDVVGTDAAPSWQFALRVLWGSAFRISDLMDFSWSDPRHIHPVWGRSDQDHPTIVIPSSQKNGRAQEIPMLPELATLLANVPQSNRNGWVVNPAPLEFAVGGSGHSFRPCSSDLRKLCAKYRISAIAEACGVSAAAVRKWDGVVPPANSTELKRQIPDEVVERLQQHADRRSGQTLQKASDRLTPERVGRVISMIGKAAQIVVQVDDPRLRKKEKFASAHDIRRGVAQRLINRGVSAETLKVVMRHQNFATTERHYGAIRSAQTAAAELAAKLSLPQNSTLVGGLVGGTKKAPQL